MREPLELLSHPQGDASAVQPLVGALTDQVLQAAIRSAEVNSGHLDPPLVTVLNEAANVCKIRDLPALYSHLGSRGISVWTILQSYRQGQTVWGDNGMDILWSAAIKIIGSGLDDPKLTDDLSGARQRTRRRHLDAQPRRRPHLHQFIHTTPAHLRRKPDPITAPRTVAPARHRYTGRNAAIRTLVRTSDLSRATSHLPSEGSSPVARFKSSSTT
jgi:hypothetical protein